MKVKSVADFGTSAVLIVRAMRDAEKLERDKHYIACLAALAIAKKNVALAIEQINAKLHEQ